MYKFIKVFKKSGLPLLFIFAFTVTLCVGVVDAKENNFKETGKSSSKNQESAVIPAFGYNSTYGAILGGKYYIYPIKKPGYYFDIELFTTLHPVTTLKTNFTKWTSEKNIFKSGFYFSNFFDPYYGEGDRTNPSSRVDINGLKSGGFVEFMKKLDENLSAGLLIGIKHRKEKDINGVSATRLFPDETALNFGLSAEFDNRDNRLNPKAGRFVRLLISHNPSDANSRKDVESFSQAEIDFRNFTPLKEELLWAMRFKAGNSFGEPTYLFRYNLGGMDGLRGYRFNRFRGKMYYLMQNELRFPVWQNVSGVAFADVGDISDDSLNRMLYSFGGGIRVTVPPKHKVMLRLDIGWGKDQNDFTLSFGQSF